MLLLAISSLVILLIATFLAFYTIRITGRKTPWTVFSFGVLFLAIHQALLVRKMLNTGTIILATWEAEIVNFIVSIVLLIGIIRGRPQLKILIRNRQLLSESEALRTNMFNRTHDMAFLHGMHRDGSFSTFYDVNEKACKTLGYSREELLQLNPLDISSGQLSTEDIQLLKATGRLISEQTLIKKTGEKIPVEISAHLYQQNGKQLIMVFARDISDRIERQKAEDRENQTCREILNLTPVSIWHENFSEVKTWLDNLKEKGVKDLRDFLLQHPEKIREAASLVKVLAINDATLRLFRVNNREQLLGKLDKLFTRESDPVFMEELVTIWNGGNHFISNISIQRSTGEKVPAILEWYTPKTPDGLDLNRVVVTLSNIQELKIVEAEKERLSALIEQTAESIMITDLSAKIVYVNRGFEKMTGYSATDALGRNPRFLKSGKTPPESYRELWSALRQGEKWRGRLYNLRKSSEPYTEEALIFPLKNESGEITHYAGVKMDITEKVELEEQLNQSRKMEAIGKLAGGIAHDFNNILTTIIGNAEMGKVKAGKDKMLRHHFAEILDSGKRGGALTRQLLAFSRRQMIKPVILNFNRVIREMDKMLRRLIGADVRYNLQTTRDILPVLADESQLQQVLMNLVVNADDAMAGQPPPRNLQISTGSVFVDSQQATRFQGISPGTYALLEVSDTGCGMTEKVRERIFEPFFTTKPMGKGTGLGLATVYGILKQNHAMIDVKSSPGLGATFRVYWPIATGEIEENQQPEPLEELKAQGDETILLVEDDDGVRRFATNGLNRLGYRVVPVENGQQAISLIEKTPEAFSVVFTDVIMPKMSGTELATTIQARFPDIPVIFSTGYTDDFLNGRGQTPDILIYKPYTINEIASRIRRLLNERRQPGDNEVSTKNNQKE